MINLSKRSSLVARRVSSLLLFWAVILPSSLPAGESKVQNQPRAGRDAVREAVRPGGGASTGPSAPGIAIGGAGYLPEHSCPDLCNNVIHHKGDVVRHCTWETAGPPSAPMVKGQILDSKTCTVSGAALDVEPRHRLFVHGLHDNRECWKDWYDYVKEHMDCPGCCPDCKTVRDNTGQLPVYGDGTARLLSQVAELAVQINDGFAGVPDGSVDVYAHSLGALKMEALLQLGYERGAGDPWFQAARKIGSVYIFQGAHGGCTATSGVGDGPKHGSLGACPASRDIGAVNSANVYVDGNPLRGPRLARTEIRINPIPGSNPTSHWNMNKIVWRGEKAEKHIYYVVAAADGGDCAGGAGILCRNSERNDGVVYDWQMAPVWYEGFSDAKAAGKVSVIETPGEYCHMAAEDHDRPMVSDRLMRAYVGMKNVRYFVPKLGEEVLIERDVAYCDESCFCWMDQLGACYNKLDCTAQGGANCKRPGGGSGGIGNPSDRPYRGPDRGGLFTTPDVDPAPSDGYDTQTTVLREIITDSGGTWIRCAAEGAVCAFSGTPAGAVRRAGDLHHADIHGRYSLRQHGLW